MSIKNGKKKPTTKSKEENDSQVKKWNEAMRYDSIQRMHN